MVEKEAKNTLAKSAEKAPAAKVPVAAKEEVIPQAPKGEKELVVDLAALHALIVRAQGELEALQEELVETQKQKELEEERELARIKEAGKTLADIKKTTFPVVVIALSHTGRIKSDGIRFLNRAASLASGGRCLNWMQQIQLAAKRARTNDVLGRKYLNKKKGE